MKKDYYQVLGLNKGASDGEIKAAYRKLAKKYHPDVNRGNGAAEQRFKEIGEAYRILGDQENKRIYDKCGSEAFENGMNPMEYEKAYDEAMRSSYGRSTQQGFDFGNSRTFYWSNDDYHFDNNSDSFESNIFESMFDDLFRQSAGYGKSYDRGRNHTYSQHYYNSDINGRENNHHDRGNNRSTYQSSQTSQEAKTITRNGLTFEVKGHDLYSTQTIPCTTAILGGEAELKTATGKVMVKIPAGTQPGKKMRFKGKGLSGGDLYITIQVSIPTNLTPYERKKMREFENLYKKHHNEKQEAG